MPINKIWSVYFKYAQTLLKFLKSRHWPSKNRFSKIFVTTYFGSTSNFQTRSSISSCDTVENVQIFCFTNTKSYTDTAYVPFRYLFCLFLLVLEAISLIEMTILFHFLNFHLRQSLVCFVFVCMGIHKHTIAVRRHCATNINIPTGLNKWNEKQTTRTWNHLSWFNELNLRKYFILWRLWLAQCGADEIFY